MFRLYTGLLTSRFHVVNVKTRQHVLPLREVGASGHTFSIFSPPRRPLSTPVEKTLDEPLRILYCGSDAFSCTSLKALHEAAQRQSGNIASIDVVCREGKPYGRGLKVVRHPEIKDVARSLALPVHQIKTFTGWEPPEYPNTNIPKINLIIAVSFGLLIPPRILNQAAFSGINLHPSMLPDYKGPAPLHWTILNGEKKTGMSLQTLHPTSFDEGLILDQTPWPGIDVPEDCDYARLLKIMQPLGAEMLVNAIQKRSFLPPRNGVSCARSVDHARGNYKHAPKLGTVHRLLNFETMDSAQVLRMSRAFESTCAFAAVPTSRVEVKRQRIIFPGPFCIISPSSDDSGENGRILEVPPGLPYLPHDAASDGGQSMNRPLLVNTVDGKTISMVSLKVEGGVQMPALRAALKHRLMGEPCKLNGKGVITFHEALTAQA